MRRHKIESQHATNISFAVANQGGMVMSEAPARRTGSKAYPKHVLAGCERAAHMFDYDPWVAFTQATGSKERLWDQCRYAEQPAEAAEHVGGGGRGVGGPPSPLHCHTQRKPLLSS